MLDAFTENGNKLIFLAEVTVGSTYDIQNNFRKLKSFVKAPLNDRGEKYDSLTYEDRIGVYSGEKCYPRYLVTI